jgi:hypothetical protein
MTKNERERHARTLAGSYGVAIRVVGFDLCPPLAPGDPTGSAYGELVEVCMPRGWTQDAYATVLHEVGHCVLGHAYNGAATNLYRRDQMQAEVDAWVWAAENAVELGAYARRFAIGCASTYARDLGREDALEVLRVALSV